MCPHETVALSAAHAYASVSRQPQAVFVHVDAGTQNLGGAVSNAMRGRVPVLIFAGAAPFTITGELPAGRNEFIHWIQDVPDQRGILRGYVKYDNEIRTGRNVKQLVHRALQIARSEPAGPVYLVGPREVMEEQVEPYAVDPAEYPPVAPAALTAEVTQEIATALADASRPLIITSYLGRNPDAVPALVELAELLAIPVLESAAFHVNFPGDHPLHAGYQFTTSEQNPVLARADVILVVDSDVPWIHATSRPSPDAAIYDIDIDPLKASMSMWHIAARRFAAADSKGKVEGADPAQRDEYVIYTAHWDHLGIGPEVNGDQIFYHGAVDNASGVAALLDWPTPFRTSILRHAARSCSLRSRRRRKACLGRSIIPNIPSTHCPKPWRISISMGSTCWGGRGISRWSAWPVDARRSWSTAAAGQGRVVRPDSEPEKGFYFRSDHFSFAKQGVPALDPIAGSTTSASRRAGGSRCATDTPRGLSQAFRQN